MIFGWAGESVVRRRAALVADEYATVGGAPAQRLDWSSPSDLSITVMVAGAGTDDPILDGRAPIDSDYTLYAEHGADFAADDRVVVRGVECEVQGIPFAWAGGSWSGLVVRCKARQR